MEKSACITIEEVSKKYGSRIILDQISLNVPVSEICGLLGPSGAGKTTLVKMIAGIETADHGTVNVLKQKMPDLSVMKHIGYMAQSDALYMELSAKENLEFFGHLYGVYGKMLAQRMEAVMELVSLTDDMHKPVNQYSGGMKRRLSLAVALLHEPDILILDEPTVGIDPVLRQSIWGELERLSQKGTSILVTTHVMDEASKCHTLGLLRDGRIIAYGAPLQLLEETGTLTIEEAFLHYGGVRS
jgi:ABC-2 type transport system ATP-binding protein